jgi:RHS repeat-associated protein
LTRRKSAVPNRVVAWRDSSGGVYYYFADMLGSTRVVTDASGNTCFNADYYPYGQENDYSTSCSPRYKFTGYEFDSETGNYYAGVYPESVVGARYYDPRRGRFMSPYPLGGTVGNPQSLNRYAYVVNDPENLTDPSGERPHPEYYEYGLDMAVLSGEFIGGGGGGGSVLGCDEFDFIDSNSYCNTTVLPIVTGTYSTVEYQYTGPASDGKTVSFDTWDQYANWLTTVNAGAPDPCILVSQNSSGVYTGTANTTLDQAGCGNAGGTWVPPGFSWSVNGKTGQVTSSAPQPTEQHSPCLWLDVGALGVDAVTLFQPELAPWAVSASAHAVACNFLWEYNP